MSLNVTLLEESFAALRPQAALLGERFYANLFTTYPETRALFAHTDIAAQQQKLVASLVLVIDNLRNPEALQSALHALGARHVHYGAVAEHYPLVGEVLLTTMAELMEDQWTPAHRQAWSDAYTAVSGLMLEGAQLQIA